MWTVAAATMGFHCIEMKTLVDCLFCMRYSWKTGACNYFMCYNLQTELLLIFEIDEAHRRSAMNSRWRTRYTQIFWTSNEKQIGQLFGRQIWTTAHWTGQFLEIQHHSLIFTFISPPPRFAKNGKICMWTIRGNRETKFSAFQCDVELAIQGMYACEN